MNIPFSFPLPTKQICVDDLCYLRFLYEGRLTNKISLVTKINPLNAELNPICHLLALLGAHLILHVSRIRVK
jgi:hypothetical protein